MRQSASQKHVGEVFQMTDLNSAYDEYEKQMEEFLWVTPYVEQILETSKNYWMFVESLKLMAVSDSNHVEI